MASPSKFAISAAALAAAATALCFVGTPLTDALRNATLVTARFSGLVFAVALISRASRPGKLAKRRAELMLAFVAAHGVHFGAVLARAVLDPKNGFHNLKLQTFLSFAIGFSLIGVLALTIRARRTTARIAHSILIYVVWALFAVAFFSGRHYPASAAMLMVVLAALLIRIGFGIAGQSKAAAAPA